ncbi:hypothetical protein Ddc_02871 [Ditylenchus destructor]|nr:hypothetical protein Ddc_02871 [Ditylenchus destructor]
MMCMILYLILLYIFLISSTNGKPVFKNSYNCESLWTYRNVNGKHLCFKAFIDGHDYHTSNQLCSSLSNQSHLATLHNQDQLEAIFKLLSIEGATNSNSVAYIWTSHQNSINISDADPHNGSTLTSLFLSDNSWPINLVDRVSDTSNNASDENLMDYLGDFNDTTQIISSPRESMRCVKVSHNSDQMMFHWAECSEQLPYVCEKPAYISSHFPVQSITATVASKILSTHATTEFENQKRSSNATKLLPSAQTTHNIIKEISTTTSIPHIMTASQQAESSGKIPTRSIMENTIKMITAKSKSGAIRTSLTPIETTTTSVTTEFSNESHENEADEVFEDNDSVYPCYSYITLTWSCDL